MNTIITSSLISLINSLTHSQRVCAGVSMSVKSARKQSGWIESRKTNECTCGLTTYRLDAADSMHTNSKADEIVWPRNERSVRGRHRNYGATCKTFASIHHFRMDATALSIQMPTAICLHCNDNLFAIRVGIVDFRNWKSCAKSANNACDISLKYSNRTNKQRKKEQNNSYDATANLCHGITMIWFPN